MTIGSEGRPLAWLHRESLSDVLESWGIYIALLLAVLGEGVTTAEIPTDKVDEWREIATYLADRKVGLYRRILGYG